MEKFVKLIMSNLNVYTLFKYMLTPEEVKPVPQVEVPKEPTVQERLIAQINDRAGEHTKLFRTLCEPIRLVELTAMMSNGYILNETSFKECVEAFRDEALLNEYHFEKNFTREQKISFLDAVVTSLSKGKDIGIYYGNRFGTSKDLCNYLLQSARGEQNPADLTIEEALKEIQLNTQLYKDVSLWDKYLVNVIAKNKVYIAGAEAVLAQGMQKVVSQLQKQNITTISAKKIDAMLHSNDLENSALVARCKLVQSAVNDLQTQYPSLTTEDKVTLKNIVEVDLPKIISSYATTPQEIQDQYKKVSGSTMEDSLNELLDKHLSLVQAIGIKMAQNVAIDAKLEIKAQGLFLDQKRKALGITENDAPSSIESVQSAAPQSANTKTMVYKK